VTDDDDEDDDDDDGDDGDIQVFKNKTKYIKL